MELFRDLALDFAPHHTTLIVFRSIFPRFGVLIIHHISDFVNTPEKIFLDFFKFFWDFSYTSVMYLHIFLLYPFFYISTIKRKRLSSFTTAFFV